MFLKGSELRRRIEVVFFVKMVMDTLMFLDRVYLTEFFRVSYTCSSDYSVYDGVYIHSLVARTFFCCTVCLRTSAHLHACAHTRMAQVSAKKVFAYVSFLSISPSPFSCLTHLLLSPYDSLSLSTFPSTHSCRTYLSSKRRACAPPHEDEKFGYLAMSALNTGYEPKKFDKITSVDSDTMLIETSMKSPTSRKTHTRTLDCSVFSQCLNPLFRTFLMMILLFK